jgi:hypothetical protein
VLRSHGELNKFCRPDYVDKKIAGGCKRLAIGRS